jgi:hypothetical protein
MSIEFRWQDEQRTAVYFEFETPWTWDEFYHSLTNAKAMMNETDAEHVDIIVQLKDDHLPKGNNSMHAMNTVRHPHPKLRYILLVTQNSFIRMLMNISAKVNPKMKERYIVLPTLEEALRLSANREQLLKAD